jgi:hypothetical protein
VRRKTKIDYRLINNDDSTLPPAVLCSIAGNVLPAGTEISIKNMLAGRSASKSREAVLNSDLQFSDFYPM